MSVKERLGRLAREGGLPLFVLALVAYFGFHAVQGERGILAWHRMKADLAHADAREIELADKRERLARRVSQLQPDSLDPDMIEEQARLLLNYGHPLDRVIMLDGSAESPEK